jgi:MFS family permease
MHAHRAMGGRERQRLQTGRRLFYGWCVTGASFVILLLSMGVQSSFGNFLKPMSVEFGWDRSTVSLPAAMAILMSGVFQPLIGRLVDQLGPRRVISLSLLAMGLSTASLAAATGIWYLAVVYGVVFAFGFSGAGIIPNTALIARWFVHQRGRAMGLVNAGGSAGQLLVVPVSMALLLRSDWRMTYFVLGGVVLLVGIPIALIVLRNDPQELGLRPDGEGRPAETSLQPRRSDAETVRAPLEPAHWKGALTSSPMWLLSGGFFACGFTTAIVWTHFVAFATERGISPASAATALGVLGGFNIVGSLLTGVVSDQMGRKDPLVIIYLLRAVSFAVLLAADSAWMLYVFAALAGLSWLSTAPLTVSLTAEIYGMRHMGTLVGLIFMCHQAGGALSIYLAGLTHDLYGSYAPVYLSGVVLLLGAGLASCAIQERRYSLRYLAPALRSS